MGYIQTHKHTQCDPSVVLIGESVQGRQNCIYYRIFFVSLTSQFLCLKIGGLLQSRGIITIYLGSISQRINIHGKTQKRKIICKSKTKIQLLLVFSGLVLEVIYCLPEESDTEQAAFTVFKQQPGGEMTDQRKSWIPTVWKTHFSKF